MARCLNTAVHEMHAWTEVNPNDNTKLWNHVCFGIEARCLAQLELHSFGQCVLPVGHDSKLKGYIADRKVTYHIDANGNEFT